MPALTTILPLTILGSLCTILFTFLARCWRQASRQREGLELGNPDYEVEEIPGTTDFVMVGMRGHRKKKVKKPKLWDISVLNLGGRRAHGRKLSSGSSFSDLSSTKDIGHWAELKVSVSGRTTSAGHSVLIFACLAHVCRLRKKPQQGTDTACSSIAHPPMGGPDSRA